MRVISQYTVNENNAGPKAKVDVENILKNKYNAKIYTNNTYSGAENKFLFKLKKTIFSIKALRTKDLVIIQIPYSNKKNLLNLSHNKIGIIHDVDGLRFNDKELLIKEIKIYNQFKYLIVHNEIMKNKLVENGLTCKTKNIELFDYISKNKIKKKNNSFDMNNPIIGYPGNLEYRKAKFVYDLNEEKMGFSMNLYGGYFEKDKLKNKKIKYIGSFSPDEIIDKMECDLGLVWSGNLDSSDENNGEKGYNKYNTPHKLSCFLAAGIPVIIWNKSASSKIVNKYNVGYEISSLYDINNLDFTDYELKRKNAIVLAEKIRKGYFLSKTLDEILKELES